MYFLTLVVGRVGEVDLKINWDVNLKGQQQVLQRNQFRRLTTASNIADDKYYHKSSLSMILDIP
jgi:hypothetical protein